MIEQIQRDIELLDALLRTAGWPREEEAWQRIRASLSPDREAVARAIFRKVNSHPDGFIAVDDSQIAADAAIKAMQGVKP